MDKKPNAFVQSIRFIRNTYEGVKKEVYKVPPKKLSAKDKRKRHVGGVLYTIVVVGFSLIMIIGGFLMFLGDKCVFFVFDREEMKLGTGKKDYIGLPLKPWVKTLFTKNTLKKFLFIPKRYRS